MGSLITRIMEKFTAIKDTKILMIGLGAAGKTTILFKLKLGENI